MKRVLIVDDEAGLIKSIEAGLKDYEDRFDVTTALNGREAIERLKERHVDLVVTDLKMPEVDGFELLSHISRYYPFLPTIVMTAFSTPEIEERVNSAGTFRLLEKPIDLERFASAILEGLEQESKEGSVAGFSLENLLQLLAMEKKTCLLFVKGSDREGYIYFENGEIQAAISGNLKGSEAFFALLAIENVQITFKKLPQKPVTKMIDKPLMSLLMEAMRRIDEKISPKKRTKSPAESPVSSPTEDALPLGDEEDNKKVTDVPEEPNSEIPEENSIKGDESMAKLEEMLDRFNDVDGFLAAGVFTPNGEMAAQVNKSGYKLAETGSIANDILLKAQKGTDVMGVGLGNVIHVEAPKAHIIARCLNENTDFAQTESGKAHIHMVLLLDKDANLAMGKMKMESVITEVASVFR